MRRQVISLVLLLNLLMYFFTSTSFAAESQSQCAKVQAAKAQFAKQLYDKAYQQALMQSGGGKTSLAPSASPSFSYNSNSGFRTTSYNRGRKGVSPSSNNSYNNTYEHDDAPTPKKIGVKQNTVGSVTKYSYPDLETNKAMRRANRADQIHERNKKSLTTTRKKQSAKERNYAALKKSLGVYRRGTSR